MVRLTMKTNLIMEIDDEDTYTISSDSNFADFDSKPSRTNETRKPPMTPEASDFKARAIEHEWDRNAEDWAEETQW